MAFPTIHRPAAADTGGHGDPHNPRLIHRPAAAPTDHSSYTSHSRKYRPRPFDAADAAPAKRQKPSAPAHDAGKRFWHGDASSASFSPPPPPGRHDDAVPQQEGSRSSEDRDLLSRDEIERCSPSRKDGIDSLVEAQLRYSYCSYLQSLGLRLQMPQTSIGTAMVLCHRFFIRRSHACHDRFLIATAALFLASKYEETPCLLNTVLRASCEICQTQNLAFYPYLLCTEFRKLHSTLESSRDFSASILCLSSLIKCLGTWRSDQDWLNQYRERVIEAEQMILTTLDFELDVHHPYIPLTSVLNKLGLSQTALMNLAWNLVSEGLRTSLWLQFKPYQIAAGAAFLAAKFLNFDVSFYQSICHEFQTTPWILKEVVQQLMELF